MKKLFFFRSSADKQVCVDHSVKSGPNKKKDECRSESLRHMLFNSQKNVCENQSSYDNPGLRRSRSLSSAAFLDIKTDDRNCPCSSDPSSSPSSSGSLKAEQHSHSFRCCTSTPERHVKTKQLKEVDYGVQKPVYPQSLHDYRDSSESSLSSSNVSNDVLELYIDGEQQNERSRPVRKTSRRTHIAGGSDKKPPLFHFTAPTSPNGSVRGKSKSHLSRGVRGSQQHLLSRGRPEARLGHESPRDLAKHVAEKLSQTQISSKTSWMEFDSTVPITLEDVYNGSLNSNVTHHKEYQSGRDYEFTDGYHKEYPGSEHNIDVSCNVDTEDELDIELRSKLKEAQERILALSEDLEQESFLHDIEFNVQALVQRIRSLTEEKVSLALEVSAVLERQLADRILNKEQLKSARLELESRTQRLQEDKNEMQSALEKELDRRSSDWSSKVEKYQAEEQRLRERVRELAEQNVSLQREVSSLSEKETERRNMITFSEKQIHDLMSMLEAAQRENRDLHTSVCELQEKCKVAEEDRSCMHKSYGEREDECKELHQCITRLARTCSQQEKTIDGLRGELSELVQKRHSVESSDKHLQKLQLEQIRLTGVEQSLRKELESYKLEADSLRHENINLLNRLNGFGKEGVSLTFKLEQELWARLQCLQQQGLSLLSESTNLCSRLLESIKRGGQRVGKLDGIEVNGNCLDGQFLIESEVKVQGFRRGTESLARSLQNIATVLDGKSSIVGPESQIHSMDNQGFQSLDEWNALDMTKSELKAEKLITSLLREKLHAKDQEVEQLQAELATSTRGIEILKFEAQNTLDSLSCATHKMKDIELQMIKKEEKISQLQNAHQETMKELAMMKGVLPKVTEERDMMWQEVKQYTEENMLLKSEVNMLKKKIEALDEDVLLKEGQITILKDSLGKKSFDLLGSPERIHEFLLE